MSQSLADLSRRVAALERAAQPQAAPPADAPVLEHLVQRLTGGADATSTLRYAGVGGWDGQTLAWQTERDWEEVLGAPAERVAAVLGALGSPIRVRITAELLRRSLTTAELAERLDQPSSGQLFHHLKELLAVGVIHQPLRGTYAVREQQVIPLLAVLSAVLDIHPGGVAER